MLRLICPRCGLTITPKTAWLKPAHCPRCIARARVAVELFASTLAADELYAAHPRPAYPSADSPPDNQPQP